MKDEKQFSMSKYASMTDMYRDMAKYYKEKCEELEKELEYQKKLVDIANYPAG